MVCKTERVAPEHWNFKPKDVEYSDGCAFDAALITPKPLSKSFNRSNPVSRPSRDLDGRRRHNTDQEASRAARNRQFVFDTSNDNALDPGEEIQVSPKSSQHG